MSTGYTSYTNRSKNKRRKEERRRKRKGKEEGVGPKVRRVRRFRSRFGGSKTSNVTRRRGMSRDVAGRYGSNEVPRVRRFEDFIRGFPLQFWTHNSLTPLAEYAADFTEIIAGPTE